MNIRCSPMYGLIQLGFCNDVLTDPIGIFFAEPCDSRPLANHVVGDPPHPSCPPTSFEKMRDRGSKYCGSGHACSTDEPTLGRSTLPPTGNEDCVALRPNRGIRPAFLSKISMSAEIPGSVLRHGSAPCSLRQRADMCAFPLLLFAVPLDTLYSR